MLKSANRGEDVAWLSRILTIKLKSFHIFLNSCGSRWRIKLQGGKDLYQVSQWQSLFLLCSVIPSPTPHPPHSLVDPLIFNIFKKRLEEFPTNKRKCIHYGEVLSEGLPYSPLYHSINVLFLWTWKSGLSEGSFEKKTWLPGKCVSLWSLIPAPFWQATRHLSGFNTTQPPIILFDKWDKERKTEATVQSIDGPYSRTKDERSGLTKEIRE